MKFLQKLFGRKRKDPAGYPPEEVAKAREEEPNNGYIPLCTRIFYHHVGREALCLTSDDLSKLDKMVLPHVMAAAMIFQPVPCNESCPGYTPVPVEPFPLPPGPSGVQNVVRCQRFIPKEMLVEGWEYLREKAIAFRG